jgi:hypothetical protein
MSGATVIIPKVPVQNKRFGGDKRYYTLHFDKRVFTVQKNGTSLVSFRKKDDAVRFGKMLETHFDMMHSWPTIDFEETVLYRNTKSHRLKYINTRSWEEDQLRNFCVRNFFNMLDIHRFEDDNRLVGNTITWEADPYFYGRLFDDMYFRE